MEKVLCVVGGPGEKNNVMRTFNDIYCINLDVTELVDRPKHAGLTFR